jgi:hypothetical protein
VFSAGHGPKVSHGLVAGQDVHGREKSRQLTATHKASAHPTPYSNLRMKNQREHDDTDRNSHARKR